MTKENVSSYIMQISQANASGLLCIAYSLWQTFVKEALEAYAAGDAAVYRQLLKKTQKVNQEIIIMMNHDNPYARDVMAIHFFANRRLTESIVKGEPVELDRLLGMMEQLKGSFEELSKNDHDAPLMKNTQQVYAGLTYGKGTLNESADPLGQAGRGFLA